MPRIPEQTIDRIREANDIVDVVEQYVPLKRRGRNYFGKCPFHQEKTASFSVAPDKQIFHCFGCGKGGNVFSFIMEYERISFVEAVERLADRVNIEIPKHSTSKDVAAKESLGPLYEANSLAMRVYEKALASDNGAEALKYLQDRNFSEETLKAFRVGYAPDDWETITGYAPKKGFPVDVLTKAGLVIKKNGDRVFDRFRHRVMFPIINLSGRVVGFGGRALDPDDNAKYMNTPESPIYRKRKILYGLFQARDYLRENREVIVVEGYTDLMRLWENGIQNVIAVSGTAFTEDHAKILKRYVDRAYLCYDGDTAGIQATLRAGYILLQTDIEVRCMKLPDGHDPDSIISEEGTKAFRTIQDQAVSLMRFRIERIAGQLNDASSKAKFLQEALDEIAEINEPLARDLQVQELAELLRVDEQRLHGELQSRVRRGSASRQREKISIASGKTLKDFTGTEQAQYELLKLLLSEDEQLITFILEHLALDEFTHPLLKNIAEVFFENLTDQPTLQPQEALELFHEAEADSDADWNALQQLITRMIFELDESETNLRKEKMAKDCLIRLELSDLQKEIEQINEQLHQSNGDNEKTFDLLKERQSLEQMKSEIREKYQ